MRVFLKYQTGTAFCFFKQQQPLINETDQTYYKVTKLSKALVNNYLLENDLALSVYSITSVDHFVDIKISYLQPFSYTIYNNHKQTSF